MLKKKELPLNNTANRLNNEDANKENRETRELFYTRSPMLMFPEGTCVNNNYTVLFQKGAFDVDAEIFPIALKYRRNLLDPYWNRRASTFTMNVFYLMTRWWLEADVWWMEGVRKGIRKKENKNKEHKKDKEDINDVKTKNENSCIKDELQNDEEENPKTNEVHDSEKKNTNDDSVSVNSNITDNRFNKKETISNIKENKESKSSQEIEFFEESGTEFAMRVKEMISNRGGLKSVLWNGYFKSSFNKKDHEILKNAYRNVFARKNKKRIIKEGEHRFAYTEKFKNENTKKELTIFNNYTYEEYLQGVLEEYLNLKNAKIEGSEKREESEKSICACKIRKKYCVGWCKSDTMLNK